MFAFYEADCGLIPGTENNFPATTRADLEHKARSKPWLPWCVSQPHSHKRKGKNKTFKKNMQIISDKSYTSKNSNFWRWVQCPFSLNHAALWELIKKKRNKELVQIVEAKHKWCLDSIPI